MTKPLVAKQNIYRTADGEIIVGDGNPRAEFHVARVGSEVPEEWVKAVKAALGDEPEDTAPEPERTVEPEPERPFEPELDASDAVGIDAEPEVETTSPKPAKKAAAKRPTKKVATKKAP